MNKSVRGHADERCQNGALLTAQASQPAAADTVAPRSGPGEAGVHLPGRLLRPCRGQHCAIPRGYDQTHPKMLILTVFYKIECSLQGKELF